MKINKKKFWYIAVCIVFLISLTNLFSSYTFSAGISIGEPTGLSLNFKKANKEEHLGYDVCLNFNTEASTIYLSFDVLKYDYKKIVSKELTGKMPIFYGFGCVIKGTKGGNEIGMEMTLGIEYIFSDIPFNIFFRISPVVFIVPSVNVRLSPAIGIRYIFK